MIKIHLPQGEGFDLNNEISQAQNIKDSKNKKDTIRGLKKIQDYL